MMMTFGALLGKTGNDHLHVNILHVPSNIIPKIKNLLNLKSMLHWDLCMRIRGTVPGPSSAGSPS